MQWWPEKKREQASELEILGEYDPLVIGPLDEDAEESGSRPGSFFLAPDEFHKANYSGGENYQVALPDARADFPLIPLDEFFISYLRETFAGGGFRGRKSRPALDLTRVLADGLAEI